MIKKIISICCMLAAIILMATPNGVRMVFMPSPTERTTSYYSYFSEMPIGYGNWFSIITVLLSIAILALLLIGMKKDTEKPVQICLLSCIAASTISWLVFGAYSIVGIIVMVLHVSVILLQIRWKKHGAD